MAFCCTYCAYTAGDLAGSMRLQYAKAAAPAGLQLDPRHDIEDELVSLSVDLTFLEGRPEIRSRSEFEARVASCKVELLSRADLACRLVNEILGLYQAARKTLAGITQVNWLASVQDMRGQLDRLVYRGFLQHTPWAQLQHFPRYLQALQLGEPPRLSADEMGRVAARMEAHTKQAKRAILIDAATRAALGEDFATEPLGPVQFKGKAAAVDVFAVACEAGQLD